MIHLSLVRQSFEGNQEKSGRKKGGGREGGERVDKWVCWSYGQSCHAGGLVRAVSSKCYIFFFNKMPCLMTIC